MFLKEKKNLARIIKYSLKPCYCQSVKFFFFNILNFPSDAWFFCSLECSFIPEICPGLTQCSGCVCVCELIKLWLFCLDLPWLQHIRVSRYPAPWAWWKAHHRFGECTPSSGKPSSSSHACSGVYPSVSSISLSFRRNKETNRDEFIFYSKRLMRLLIEHALSFLPLKVRAF